MPRSYYRMLPGGRHAGAGIRLWLALLMTGLLALIPGGSALAAYSTDVQFISAPSPLAAIDCPTSTTCFVVSYGGGTFSQDGEFGSGTETPLTIDANGTIQSGASIAPEWVSGVQGGGLSGIACPSPDACYVVGRVYVFEIEHSGSVFTKGGVAAMTSENGTVTGHNIRWVDGTVQLNAIACPTSSTCYAVGHNGLEGVILSVAVDGDSVDPGSYAVISHASSLSGIACPTSSTCYAVGDLSNEGVVVTFNTADIDAAGDGGDAGSAQVIGGTGEFTSIACPSASACYLAGNGGGSGQVTSIAVNGSGVVSNSIQTISGTTVLKGIACVDASTCYAVGNVSTGDSSSDAVIVQFALFNSPVQKVIAIGDLSSIACAGGSCYAAGTNAVTGQSVVTTIQPQEAAATSLSLVSSANPSVYGQAVSVTATVTPASGTSLPTGAVQFAIDGSAYGAPVPLVDNNGQAQAVLTLPALQAGSHTMTASYGGNLDFTASSASPLAQTVTRAELTITADDQSIVAGDALPALTYTPSGFVNGDDASVLSGAPSLTTTATAASPTGTYPISVGAGSLAAANYAFTFVDGTLTVSADNQPPVADAGANQTVNEGATVTLDASRSTDPDEDSLTYDWDVIGQNGPGISLSSNTAASPTFVTTDNGTYTFRVTVSDGNGGTDSDDVAITVNNVAPTATFTATDAINEGGTIALAVTSPADPSAVDTQTGFTYIFDCGLGYVGQFDAIPTATCTPSDSGNLTVKAKVRDKDGGTTEYTSVVAVNNVAPAATFTAPAAAVEGGPLTLTLSDPSDPNLADTQAGFDYAFDCGNGYAAFGGGSTANCQVNDSGILTVKGKIRDKDGGVTEYTASVTVTNVAPVATFSAPDSTVEGSPITLTLSNPTDPGAADTAAGFEYAFDCGDGYGAFGASNSATCVTNDNGTRTVKGQIRDQDGGVSEYTASIIITNANPSATLMAPASVAEGASITLSLADPSDSGSADIQAGFSYAFDCGAGYGEFGPGNSATCSTADSGSLTVKGQIRDKDGGVAEYTASVAVTNVAPSAIFNAPDTISEGAPIALSLTSPSDPSAADTQAGFSYAFDCGTGYGDFGTTNSATCSPSDSASLTVRGQIRDQDGAISEYTRLVTIVNAAPSIDSFAPSTDPVAVNTVLSFSAKFTDPGATDTHTATLNWGDGATSVGAVTEAGGSGSVSGDHTFTQPGSYTVTLIVTDDAGASAEATYRVTVLSVAQLLDQLRGDTVRLVANRGAQRALIAHLDLAERAPSPVHQYLALILYRYQLNRFAMNGAISPDALETLDREARQMIDAIW